MEYVSRRATAAESARVSPARSSLNCLCRLEALRCSPRRAANGKSRAASVRRNFTPADSPGPDELPLERGSGYVGAGPAALLSAMTQLVTPLVDTGTARRVASRGKRRPQ